MSAYLNVIKKQWKPTVESLRDDLKNRKDPDFFWPTGTQVYIGRQGSGKTISAMKHVLDLKIRYPKAILVSNVQIAYFEPLTFTTKEELLECLENIDPNTQYILFQDMDQLAIALTTVNNGFCGVIYLLDEIHTYFNALDSKNIPMYVFTEISQQRKQRKLIIGTSQLFLRMAKPLREQCDNLVICKTRMGFFTHQTAYDGMSLEQDYSGKMTGDVRKKGWFFHNRKLRNAFDTYQKVVSGAEQYEQISRVDLKTEKNSKFKIK